MFILTTFKRPPLSFPVFYPRCRCRSLQGIQVIFIAYTLKTEGALATKKSFKEISSEVRG